MKETYHFLINLPFGDIAEFDYEMTEEEHDNFLEFSDDCGIWDEDDFSFLLSAAAVAAAEYIVGFYCENPDAIKVMDEYSCTIEKLMDYFDEDDEWIEYVLSSDGQYKRSTIVELLEENQAFTLSDD